MKVRCGGPLLAVAGNHGFTVFGVCNKTFRGQAVHDWHALGSRKKNRETVKTIMSHKKQTQTTNTTMKTMLWVRCETPLWGSVTKILSSLNSQTSVSEL